MPINPPTEKIDKGCFNETAQLGKFNEGTGLGKWAVQATLMSMNPDGTMAWYRDLGRGAWSNRGYTIKLYPSGVGTTDFLFVNQRSTSGQEDPNTTVWRLDVNGDTVWALDTDSWQTYPQAADVDSLGNLVLGADTTAGTLIWSVSAAGAVNWGPITGGISYITGLVIDSLNNIITTRGGLWKVSYNDVSSYTSAGAGRWSRQLNVQYVSGSYYPYRGKLMRLFIDGANNWIAVSSLKDTTYGKNVWSYTTGNMLNWQYGVGAAGEDPTVRLAAIDSNGNAIINADADSSGAELWSVKSSTTPNWSIALGGTYKDHMVVDLNDNIIVCGTSGVASFSSLGVLNWSHALDGNRGWNTAVDPANGKVYVMHGVYPTLNPPAFPTLTAFDAAGVLLWSTIVHSHDIFTNDVGKMVVHPSGNILIPLGRKYY